MLCRCAYVFRNNCLACHCALLSERTLVVITAVTCQSALPSTDSESSILPYMPLCIAFRADSSSSASSARRADHCVSARAGAPERAIVPSHCAFFTSASGGSGGRKATAARKPGRAGKELRGGAGASAIVDAAAPPAAHFPSENILNDFSADATVFAT